MKRSNRHVWIGLGFVAASIIVATVLFFGLKIGTISEQSEQENDVEIAAESLRTLPNEEKLVAVTNSSEEQPLPTLARLVGSWRNPMPEDLTDRINGCETDSMVTFNADGSFTDGGSYGKYSLDGNTLTYSAIVLFDQAAAEGEQKDYSRFDTPSEAEIERVGSNILTEDGELLHRCSS